MIAELDNSVYFLIERVSKEFWNGRFQSKLASGFGHLASDKITLIAEADSNQARRE